MSTIPIDSEVVGYRTGTDQPTEEAHHKPKLGAPFKNRNPRKHDLSTARRVMNEFGLRAIDGRSSVGIALREFRNGIANDLGGIGELSAPRRAILDMVVREKLILDSLDAWILSQPSIVNRKTRSVIPVVRERDSIAESFVRHLTVLGLDRVKPKPKTLQQICAERAAERAASASTAQHLSAPVNAVQRPVPLQPMPGVTAIPVDDEVAAELPDGPEANSGVETQPVPQLQTWRDRLALRRRSQQENEDFSEGRKQR